MKANFEELPIVEDLVGAGMPFSEATAFLEHIAAKAWSPLRAWAYLLKRQTNSFPKFDQDEVSKHIRDMVGDKPLDEVIR